MAHLIQVGAGSGGMAVLDLLCRDTRITHLTLIEPDEYKIHNVHRHFFSLSEVGKSKARLAQKWVEGVRPGLDVTILEAKLDDPLVTGAIEEALNLADIGVCAVDNEAAKFQWDALMRRAGIPWTLGEVLSGGIGGFCHWFLPSGPCYGCIASHLQRNVSVDKPETPDYSQPGAAIFETSIPASKASIAMIAALHAEITLQLLESPSTFDPGFDSLLFTLRHVPDVFDKAFKLFKFRVPKSAECLICRPLAAPSSTQLDEALDRALGQLGDA